MKKVGQVLKETRIAAGFSIDDVEKKTKIRKKIIISLEEGRYNELPPQTYVKGLIKNYGNFLKISSNSLLALYRREYYSSPDQQSAFLNLPFRFRPTPVLTVTFFGVLAFLAVLCYIGFQYFSLISAPLLVIENPKDFAQVLTRQVEITGKTDPEATLSVNNEKVNIDQDGKFAEQINLNEGLNEIEVKAVSKFGRERIIKKTVQYVPPK
jgi:cytoskeletal protein RodZ